MNSIQLKSVGELLGLSFYIPNYQRGYRWTEVQVRDLLNDIDTFITGKRNGQSSEYYCLQPLVVKETLSDVEGFLNALPKDESGASEMLKTVREAIGNNSRWEVIDGQQRLTTSFIILSYLSSQNVGILDQNNLFEITYQTRTDSRGFLNNIAANSNKDVECKGTEKSIDFHYMREAFRTVESFFSGDKSESNYKKAFARTLLEDVRFIWYETNEKVTTVFKRLNMGKIGLTNAELIKALILNKSNFCNREEKRITIANQWDEFEYTLQNDEFWLFIHSTDYGKPTRIEFIFDLMCELGVLDKHIGWSNDNDKNKSIGTDKYRTFRYFNAYFESKNAAQSVENAGLTPVQQCWNEVKAIFRIFEEWYSDLELYHYVGFLINEGVAVKELLKDWAKGGKDVFLESLKSRIKEKISSCKDLDQQYGCDGQDKTKCRPLLLLHNIQTVINQNEGFRKNGDYKLGVFYKFPFHLYKRESWNVEHIDSNTTNTLEEKTEQYKWLKVSWIFLPAEESELRKKIDDYINRKKDGNDTDKFDKLQLEVLSHFEKGGELSSVEKNKIWNYVLLDEHTNKSYGNSIFPMKRMVISGKDKGIEYKIENDAAKYKNKYKLVTDDNPGYKTAFVPPVTKSVFMKEYNPLSSNPYSWNVADAETYKNNISKTLSEFLN